MSECTHDCSSCSQSCGNRIEPESLLAKPHELSHIKKVIGVCSGKGGVGKSLVTSLLAVLAQRQGLKTGILDADITGPSIPKAFGIKEKAMGTDTGILPVKTRTGIDVMSLNLLLDNDSDPVVWRGPVIAGAVGQFWTDVIWGDKDVLFIDMPPGTGDVMLTVFQTIPVDGVKMCIRDRDMTMVYMPYILDGKEYFDDLGRSGKQKEYFDNMRAGAVPVTSLLPTAAYVEYFEPCFKEAVSYTHLDVYKRQILYKLHISRPLPSS